MSDFDGNTDAQERPSFSNLNFSDYQEYSKDHFEYAKKVLFNGNDATCFAASSIGNALLFQTPINGWVPKTEGQEWLNAIVENQTKTVRSMEDIVVFGVMEKRREEIMGILLNQLAVLGHDFNEVDRAVEFINQRVVCVPFPATKYEFYYLDYKTPDERLLSVVHNRVYKKYEDGFFKVTIG